MFKGKAVATVSAIDAWGRVVIDWNPGANIDPGTKLYTTPPEAPTAPATFGEGEGVDEASIVVSLIDESLKAYEDDEISMCGLVHEALRRARPFALAASAAMNARAPLPRLPEPQGDEIESLY